MRIRCEDFPVRVAIIEDILLVELYDLEVNSPQDPMEVVRKSAQELLVNYSKVKVFICIRSGSKLPPSWKRDAMSRWFREYGKRLESIVCLEGEGFWNAAFRGLISSIILASGKSQHFTIESAMKPALKRLVGENAKHTQAETFFKQGSLKLREYQARFV
jgi:hypothetical protein